MLNNNYYRLAYEFHKRWSPMPGTVDAWVQCGKEAASICAENGNDRFLMDLLLCVYADLEREVKARGKDAA